MINYIIDFIQKKDLLNNNLFNI